MITGDKMGRDKLGDWDWCIHMGNSTQYSAMAYLGKEYKKIVDIWICITESLCCTPEINIKL